jgi:zinc transport system substrate-binding protein
MKISRILPILLLLTSLGLVSCAPSPAANAANTIGVTVSILPEKNFVERIGGSLVSVNVMVGPGADPHTYEPKPAQMAALSNASIFFRIGVEYENAWLDRISSTNPKMKIVNLADGIQKLAMPAHQDAQGAASGEGLDPHIWTSPALVKSLAERIYSELSAIDPANEPDYKTNLGSFQKDIDALDLEIRSSFNNLPNHRIMVFHPAWAYFARDYNLEQIPIEIGGTEPSASELAKLIDTAKADNIRVIFAQPEFSTQIAKYIAKEIGGEVILISDLAENWLENLRQVAQAIKKSL